MPLTPEQKARKAATQRARRQTPEAKALRNAQLRERRQTDQGFREREHAYQKEWNRANRKPLTSEQKARRAAQVRAGNTPERKARVAANARARRENQEIRERGNAIWRKSYQKNKEKWLKAKKAHRAKPEIRVKNRESQRKLRSNPEYYQKVLEQNNVGKTTKKVRIAGRPRPDTCECCGRNTDDIVFDHCHRTGEFRGWLCRRCNFTLGLVDDNLEILVKLAVYLTVAVERANLETESERHKDPSQRVVGHSALAS